MNFLSGTVAGFPLQLFKRNGKKSPKRRETKSNRTSDGVYVSIDTLLNLRHRASAEKRAVSGRVKNGLPGEVLSVLKGPGIEFEDIRPYLPGDDLRHVDWRVTARTGSPSGLPFVRRYAEDREHSTLIVVDQRINMFFGSGNIFKSFAAALRAAKLAWFAVENNHRLGGVIASSQTIDIVPVGAPKRSILEFFNKLHRHNTSLNIGAVNQTSLEDILKQVSVRLQPGIQVTIFSDFNDLTNDAVTMIAAMANNCRLILVCIFDQLEENIPRNGVVGIANGIRTQRATINRASRKRYQEKRAELDRRLDKAADLPGVVLVRFDANAID